MPPGVDENKRRYLFDLKLCTNIGTTVSLIFAYLSLDLIDHCYTAFQLICSAVMDGVLLLLSFGHCKRLRAGTSILSFGLVLMSEWWTWDGGDHMTPHNVPRADSVVAARK